MPRQTADPVAASTQYTDLARLTVLNGTRKIIEVSPRGDGQRIVFAPTCNEYEQVWHRVAITQLRHQIMQDPKCSKRKEETKQAVGAFFDSGHIVMVTERNFHTILPRDKLYAQVPGLPSFRYLLGTVEDVDIIRYHKD